MKLTGLSTLNIAAVEQVYADVPLVRSGKTFIELPESAVEARRRIGLAMDAMPDRRHHPYASLHAVMRKLDKAAGPEAPADAPVVTESQEEATTAPSEVGDGLEDDDIAALDSAEHPEKAKLDREIAAFQTEHDKLEASLPSLQAEYDKAWERERKYEDTTIPEKVKQECDRLSARLISVLEQQKAARLTINRLSNPAELARRIQDSSATTERIKTMADKAPKKQTAREMGVPDVYLAENGNFKPGLDARYKSDLVNSALGIKDKKALATFSVSDAETRLQVRSWTGFLTRKREIIAAKEAAKAKAKAAKPAAKKATAKAKTDDVEVTPDAKPKPAAKRRGGRLQSKAGATS